MNTEQFRQLVAAFLNGQTPRVWSFLVTVFGELTQGADIHISGATLTAICTEIGIKPEAMRVALHRLRKNGWIISQKTGRSSNYFLTPVGREETLKARPVIYAADPLATQAWLCLGPAQSPRPDGAVSLGAQSFVSNLNPEDADYICHEIRPGAPLPGWILDRLCNEETRADAAELATQLSALCAVIDNSGALTPLQIATLRILLVHSWRRIVLKLPPLPDHAFGPDWSGAECRNLCQRLLCQFPQQGVDLLE